MGLVIDTDSHVYEPAAIWDDYVPEAYRPLARHAFWHAVDEEGNRVTVLNGVPARDLNRSRIIRQAIWRPGATPESIGGLDPDVFPGVTPGASDPAARLADMDAMGVDQAIVYPTLFGEYLPQVANPELAAVLARAYNDWARDFAAAGRGRLHPVAVLPLQSLFHTRQELDRVAELGFRSVLMRPMFLDVTAPGEHGIPAMISRLARTIGAGSPPREAAELSQVGTFIEDKPFRPLWRRIEELGLVACIHPSLGITNPEGVSNGSFIERVSQKLGVGHTVAEPVAALMDNALFLTVAFFHGLLEDHPRLRLAFAHSGASWLPLALEKAETYLWLSFASVLEPVSLEPEDVFERQPVAVSFDSWERSVAAMPDLFAAKAAWGSRYPHHDAAGPDQARTMLEQYGVEDAVVDRLLGGNASELFGLGAAVRAG